MPVFKLFAAVALGVILSAAAGAIADDGSKVFETILNDGLQANVFSIVKDPATNKIRLDPTLGTPIVELVDHDGLDRLLQQHQPLLTPTARNFLVGICKLADPNDQPTWVFVLRRIGRVTKDPMALRLASNAEDELGLPRRSDRGIELLKMLMAELIHGGAIVMQQHSDGDRSVMSLKNSEKLDQILLEKRAWLTPDLVDTAIAINDRFPHSILLRAIGKLHKDDRPIAYADFYDALMAAHKSGSDNTLKQLREAAERFARLEIPRTETDARIALGKAYEQLDRDDEALTEFELARPLCRRSYGTSHRRWPELLLELCRHYRMRDECQRALFFHVQAIPIVESTLGPSSDLAVQLIQEFGLIELQLGDAQQAAESMEHALLIRRELLGATDEQLGPLRLSLVECYLQCERLEEADEQLRLTMRSVGQAANHRVDALVLLSKLRMKRNQPAAAKEALEQALRNSEGRPWTVRLAIWRQMADALREQGDVPAAIVVIEKAFTELGFGSTMSIADAGVKLPQSLELVSLLAYKARLIWQQADLERDTTIIVRQLRESQQLLVSAIDLLDRAHTASAGLDDQMRSADRLAYLFSDGVAVLLRLYSLDHDERDLRQAFSIQERGRARLLAKDLRAPTHFDSEEVAGLYRVQLDRLAALRSIDRRFADEIARPAGQRNPQAAQTLFEERRNAQVAYDEASQALKRSAPRWREILRNLPCSLEEARECLYRDEVGLVFVLGARSAHVLAISASGDDRPPIQTFELTNSAEILDVGAALCDERSLQRIGSTHRLGSQLYDLLLKPVSEAIVGKDLCIIATGTGLDHVPFELLVASSDASSSGEFLGRNRCIRYAASLTALHSARHRTFNIPRTTRLFLVGDALYGEDLGQLPGSKDEILTMQTLLSPDQINILTGADATETKIKAASASGELAKCRYLHFGVHGLTSYGMGSQPGLVFSRGDKQDDGVLEPDEVLTLQLNSELVVLSACASGVGRISKTEGNLALSRSFLAAGCNAALASLWKVEDASTAHFMDRFYRQIFAGDSSRKALQATKRQMIDDGYPPFAWSAFVLFGH
jgi:CHAT domain-containing protein/tetratricopeptide (TPR) repeat protein